MKETGSSSCKGEPAGPEGLFIPADASIRRLTSGEEERGGDGQKMTEQNSRHVEDEALQSREEETASVPSS